MRAADEGDTRGGGAIRREEARVSVVSPSDGLIFTSATDIGRTRDHNEDFIGDPRLFEARVGGAGKLDERGWLFAVADGLGGHARGEIASRLAVETLFTSYYAGRQDLRDPKERLKQAFAAANSAVYQAGHLMLADGSGSDLSPQDAPLSRMGTTLVAAVVLQHTIFVGNVGDSRAYVLEGNRLSQISEDHSLIAEEVRQGLIGAEEARNLPLRNVITRALGARESLNADFFWRTWPGKGRLLLCSDGLHGPVKDPVIESTLKEYQPAEAARRLIEAANAAGGPDNISVVVVVREAAP